MRSAVLQSFSVATLLAAQGAFAAPPDAGQTLQQLQPPAQSLPQAAPSLQLQAPAAKSQAGAGGAQVNGAQVTLTRVRVISTVFSSDDLAALVQDAYGKQFDLAGLNALADRITAYCRAQGYPFAVAMIPPQTASQGEVTIRVIEGRYSRITASGESSQDAGAWLERLHEGEPITQAPLERSLRVLSTLPGMSVSAVMEPGGSVGSGDLGVDLRRDRFGGVVGVDNHGNRYTGRTNAAAGLWSNGFIAFGDRVSLDAQVTSESLWHGAFKYELPLGTDGLRANVGYAHTHYQLAQEFESLDATGSARIAKAGFSYPLLLAARGNVSTTLDYEHRWLHDEQGAVGADADKSSNSVRAAVLFDWRDGFGGSGLTWGGFSWTRGRLTLDDKLRNLDASTAHTQGSFDILSFDLSRLQKIAGPVSFYVHANAQHANQNLDSSERFGLGGAQGVRAYPSGEGYGDEGALLQTELRIRAGYFTPYGFYDAGWVRLNADPWTDGRNHRDLGGAGLGLRFNASRVSADLSVAWRTRGGVPEADTSHRNPMLWAGMQSRF